MSRHYKIDGLELPSVTTIISDCTDKSGALTQWAANMVVEYIKGNIQPSMGMHDNEEDPYYKVAPYYEVFEVDLDKARMNFREVSKTALDIGSAVHQSIEDYLMTGKDPQKTKEDDRILAGFIAFLEWMDDNHVEVIGVEETVRGDYWAGTLDLLCNLNGVVYVVDFKTSKAIYPADMGPQIAAYRSAFDVRSDCLVEGSAIIRLDKETGLPEFKDFSKRYESDLNIFNKMVALFFARHPILAKKANYKED